MSNAGPVWSVTVALLVLFLCGDLGLNSSMEYDIYEEDENRAENASVLVFGLHIVLQASTFLVLMLMMGETFLFQVGLLQILAKQFPLVVVIHPIYLAYNTLLGAFRTQILQRSNNVLDLWDDEVYATFSVIHKMVAVVYYVLNLRAAMKLGDPIYYRRRDALQLANTQK